VVANSDHVIKVRGGDLKHNGLLQRFDRMHYARFITPRLTSPYLTVDKRVLARSLKQAETTREQIGGLVLFAMELQR
jgi:hypothetical protein